MSEAQRKAEETWEALEKLDMNDPNYQIAMQEWRDACDEARAEGNKEFTKIGRDMEKMFQNMEAENEELTIEVEELRAQIQLMEEIST